MEQNLILEQRQLLSQKMIQSLEILQMNTQELEQFLKDKALENPMLDLEEVYKTKDENSKLLKKLEWLEKTDEQNRVYYGQDHTDYEPVNFQNQTEDFGSYLPIKSSLFSLKIKDFFNISSINISEEGAIGMDISLYLVRK